MPRRPRIHLPGFPLHVVQRGHNRDACFFAEEDYLVYCEWLGEACKATGCALYAYVPDDQPCAPLADAAGIRGCLPADDFAGPALRAVDQHVVPSHRHLVGQPLQVFPGADRLANYRALFRPELDTEAISDIRMALDQGQPLGDARFIDSIERATGQRREIRPRGRPRKAMLEETRPQDQMSLEV